MKKVFRDDEGSSVVIATLLLVSLTVLMAGALYLISVQYTDMDENTPEIMNIKVSISSMGITELDGSGSETGLFYSALIIENREGVIDWSEYRITVASEQVFSVPSDTLQRSDVPDASDDPAPHNSGRTSAGGAQYFTEEDYRSDFHPLTKGSTYLVRIINVNRNAVVWVDDVRCV
ncbi:MAG: hypothetical protein ACMUIE_03175 [Thermoplasmatota archaeon]